MNNQSLYTLQTPYLISNSSISWNIIDMIDFYPWQPLASMGILSIAYIRTSIHLSTQRSVCPSVSPSQIMKLQLLTLFNISSISLKFGGVMHSTGKQITIKIG